MLTRSVCQQAMCGYIGPKALPALMCKWGLGDRDVAPAPRFRRLFPAPIFRISFPIRYTAVCLDLFEKWFLCKFIFNNCSRNVSYLFRFIFHMSSWWSYKCLGEPGRAPMRVGFTSLHFHIHVHIYCNSVARLASCGNLLHAEPLSAPPDGPRVHLRPGGASKTLAMPSQRNINLFYFVQHCTYIYIYI